MKKRMWQGFSISVLCLALPVLMLVACGGGDAGSDSDEAMPAEDTAAPAAAFDESTVGALHGVVKYENGDDPDTAIRMSADPSCQGLHTEPVYTETLKAMDGNLGDVFVYIKTGLESYDFPAPSEPARLEQEGCIYHPHVSGIMVGQPLKIVNNDPTLHNVHATPSANPEFNQGQPFQGMELDKTFDTAEVMVPFKCDVHPWMSSYLAVVEHPYFAVSGEDGSFHIDKVPPGTYTVEAWHETLGTQVQEVTVGANETVELELTFKPAA